MGDKRITQIPFPGSSGQTPTGAMQFMDDWPGLFIRGDDAIGLMGDLRRLERILEEKYAIPLPYGLEKIAAIIERDVICRQEP